MVSKTPLRMKNSPTKLAEPGIASSAIVTMMKSAASTGARFASPPISRMSSVPARSISTAMIRKTTATTSPWLNIWITDPSPPAALRLKMPIVMKPIWAIDE